MRLPYIKFIEVLIIGRLTPAAIQRKLSDVNIKFPDRGITEVHKQLRKNYPEHFSNERPPASIELLRDLDIEKMFSHIFGIQTQSGTEGIKGAMVLMNDPRMYKLVTSMAMAKITDQDIELIVNGRYNSDYSFEDIREFLHYFFNVSKWKVTEKEAYRRSVKEESLRYYYNVALKGDKDYLLWKLGASPDKSFPDMIKDVMVDSYYNFKDKSRTSSEDAQRWGTLMVKLSSTLEKMEKETGKKLDLFDEVIFKVKSSGGSNEPPHISDISDNQESKVSGRDDKK